MAIDAAHRERWQTFEVVFGIPLLIAFIVQWAVPFSLPRGWLTPVVVTAGIAFMLLGMILIVRARRELKRNGQPTDPGHPTHKIVTTGVFAVSRNPLYLGGIGVLAGFALALNLPWVMVFLLPAIVACHYILIAPEERYLTDKFGEEYKSYRKHVCRWVGRNE